MVLKAGDHVIISGGKKHEWFVQLAPGKALHTHAGIIPHDGIVGKEFGDMVGTTNTGAQFILVKPLMHDISTRFARKTQIVYPKDTGYVIMNAGIVPGSRVLEAGTGSGAMTSLLASIAGARAPGRVVSFEVVEKHHEAAKRNLALAGLSGVVDMRLGDLLDPAVQKSLEMETPFDACFFDMPSPWDVVDLAHAVLVPGGVFCSFSPVIEQVKKIVATLKLGNWTRVEAVDLQLRTWQVKDNATRPASHGHHTGYLVFARKTNVKPPLEWDRKVRKALNRELAEQGLIPDEVDDGALDFLDE